MARALTTEQAEAADFLARIYNTAAERKPPPAPPEAGKADTKTRAVLAAAARKQGRNVADTLRQWIDPDTGDAEARATLASVLSEAIQSGPLAVYGVDRKIEYYRAQLGVFMPVLEDAARTWAMKELTRQEIRIGSIQLFVRNRLHDVHVAASAVRKVVTAKTFVLPLTTAEQMREITGESGGGGVTVTRLTRVQYMWAVNDARARSKEKKSGASVSQASRDVDAYNNLFYLMVHPRGVSLMEKLAASPGTGWVFANETFEESLGAIRALRADIASGDTLVWNFPPAVIAGLAELGRRSDPGLNRFALAWAQTRKTRLESALDTAANVVLALSLVGGPVNVVAEVLDFALSAVQTAVSFIRDVEQDQAATATAFAAESERLSKGPRRLGTILQGAATIIQALALPASVSAITKSGKQIAKAVEQAPALPVRSTPHPETLARGVGRDTAGAMDRGIATEARQLQAPAPGQRPPGAQDIAPQKQAWAATAGDPKVDWPAQRMAGGGRQIPRPPKYGSKSAPRLGSAVPELPILPRGLGNYSKKQQAAFFRANRAAYPPHIQQMIDALPNPKQKMPDSLFNEIDAAIREIHTATANRMAGFGAGAERPFVRSVRGASNEGGRFSSMVTDNKLLTLHGQIRGGGIVEFDSVRFAESTIIETKMNLNRLSVEDIQNQMLRQAEFVDDWKKWSVVRWEIWDPDPNMAALAEGIRSTKLPDRLAERIQIVHMQ